MIGDKYGSVTLHVGNDACLVDIGPTKVFFTLANYITSCKCAVTQSHTHTHTHDHAVVTQKIAFNLLKYYTLLT